MLKIRFCNHLINVVHSLYFETLIFRLKTKCVLQIFVVLSLARLKNQPRLVNNKEKELDNETSESVDGSLQIKKTSLKFIRKSTKIPYSFFYLQNMSKLLDQQYNRILLILKSSKNQKERIKRKSHFYLNPIQDGAGQKVPPTSFSPVNSTNVGVSPQNFLTFRFKPFATLV